MSTQDRWEEALEAEIEYDHFNRSGRHELERMLSGLQLERSVFDDSRVLEVGAGNGPVYAIEESRLNVGIDPLSGEKDSLVDVTERSGDVVTSGIGECLPFRNDSFDVVICNNVLDHTESPKGTIREIKRVLSPKGMFLLRVHAFPVLRFIRHLLDYFDAPHPHHFHPEELNRLIKNSGFDIERQTKNQPSPFEGPNFKFRIATGVFQLQKIGIVAIPSNN